ncbi:hypothetical protein UWK_02440 [Desulfocapsa sulfexigens DSM 10523]|uniref:Uncharacterized protein n=1 Tax=Desulfocapsa sulfexigens (strain DSM 10523 / SB164P1) TaxID=1167006 RepID=M1NHA7_DESSD|nr:hypothetical protein UWK_02440 [Desulfocapsa sulfexigens DSM 10523]
MVLWKMCAFYSAYRRLLSEKIDILIVYLTNDIAPDVTITGLEKV